MTNLDIAKVKKAKHIFIHTDGKNDLVCVKIAKKEALFILEHNDGEFVVDFISKHLNGKDWTEAFIKPAE